MPSPRTDNDTFIHRARRTQLVDTAIAVIADLGTDRATISRIAAHAGVTRGVVTYHFRDRTSLFDAVVAHVYELAHRELDTRVHTTNDPRESLREFIIGSLDFYADHPAAMAALSAIYRSPDTPRSDRAEHRSEITDLQDILVAGTKSGQFRDFDPSVMADTIRAALDAALVRIRSGTDIVGEKRELWAIVDGATRITG
ncbi:TetR family transcriptional regulator [Gordonia sp. LSe1-13]|uniref:TetR family transcriptional regulator n=1 Tax=Gordonia sesuvii TaxID=3116777 RepID=A0ABU7MJ35_9ACTN|nr:TetR family transcriptional regulator [Gordonia sp. LSe1-13]